MFSYSDIPLSIHWMDNLYNFVFWLERQKNKKIEADGTTDKFDQELEKVNAETVEAIYPRFIDAYQAFLEYQHNYKKI